MARASVPFLRGGNLRKSLGTSLNGLLQRVPAEELKVIKDAVRREASERGLVYDDDAGNSRATPVMLRPRVLGGNQRAYLHRLSRVMEGAWLKMFSLWRAEPAVRRLLPLTESEERWMRELLDDDAPDQVLFGRFDCSTDFGSTDWVKGTQLFEFNIVGAAGLYMAPTVEDIVLRHVVPALRRHAPTLLLEPNDDPRRVLLETLADHARYLRLKRFHVALVQDRALVGGVTEFDRHEAWFRSMGVEARWVSPKDLVPDGDGLRAGDFPVDIVYRDHEVNDLAAREAAGEDMSGMRQALRRGRCVSSLAGEFDHKSAFQVFTTPALLRHFTREERTTFQRHVPWTRLVEETRTEAPDGAGIDLLPWLAAQREGMVLKPNRGFGGEGVIVGRDTDPAAWTAALERAAAAPRTWVVQGYRPVAEKDFPVIDEDGNLGLAEHFTVLGLFASEQRLGILGRASRKMVVNVAQRGGVVAVLRLL
jgi:hypothetical protein